MLQQTQASRVILKYREFLSRFPTFRSLAAATLRDVLKCWSGLGYNRRARQLWECARIVASQHRGRLPADVNTLRELPGIGLYTAGAIASFAFGAREPAVDTNVRRVLSRAVHGLSRTSDAQVWRSAREVLPQDAGRWNHALMDIGALFCRATPRCDACPLRNACTWALRSPSLRASSDQSNVPGRKLTLNTTKSSRYEGSRRQYRGRVIRALTNAPSLSFMQLGPQVKESFGKTDLAWLHDLLADLEREGLVALNPARTRVALP